MNGARLAPTARDRNLNPDPTDDVKPGRRHSLRTQLIAWNIAALALLLIALGVVIQVTVRSFMLAGVRRELETRVSRLVDRPPHGPFGPGGPDNHGGPPPFPNDGGHPHGGGPESGFGSGPYSPGGPNGFHDNGGPHGFHNGPDDFHGGGPHGEEHGGHGPGPQEDFQRPPQSRGHGGPGGPEQNPYRPRLFDLQGKSLDTSDTSAQNRVWDTAAFAQAKQGAPVYSTVTVDGEPYAVLSRRVMARGAVRAVVQAPYPLADVNLALASLNRTLLLLSPLALVGAGLGGALLTDRVLKRVRRLTRAAEQIGAQHLASRLPVSGTDEFSELAETFNGMLARLETAFQQQERLLEQQRRFTADASHELKTPLTIIRGTASLARMGQMPPDEVQHSFLEIDAAAETMSHLVQDLLLLARSDGGQLGREPTLLLLREVLERAQAGLAHRDGAPITLALADESLCILGNEAELIRLFANLIGNAVQYTPCEGCINIAARQEGGRVTIAIADTGIGIAAEHLPHLGERFYRVDTSRSRPTGGTGLGLSISGGIVAAHGGTLDFASTPGEGTTVTVTLPAA